MNLRGQLEKITRDITTGPDLSDSIEIAIVGGAFGALVGFAKGRDKDTALSFAGWGAGLGVGVQYILFHMLRNAARPRVRFAARGDDWGNVQPTCPPGQRWNPGTLQCVSQIPAPPPPQPMPPTLDEWRRQHAVSGDFFTGTGDQYTAAYGPQAGETFAGQQGGWGPVLDQPQGCPPGQWWDSNRGACVPLVPAPPPPPAHKTGHEGYYVGAVNRGGYKSDMPYGPGPWPTQYTPDPQPFG